VTKGGGFETETKFEKKKSTPTRGEKNTETNCDAKKKSHMGNEVGRVLFCRGEDAGPNVSAETQKTRQAKGGGVFKNTNKTKPF